MDMLHTSLLSNILSRCKHSKLAHVRRLDLGDGDLAPLSSYRLVSEKWAPEILQLLGTIMVPHSNFEELDQSSLQSLLERAPHIKILDIAFPILPESSKSSDNTVGSSESSFDHPPRKMVDSPARDALLKPLGGHEWVELRARDGACPFVQILWANSKLQILDMDVIDFPDRSQLQSNDANLLLAALLHNTSLTSLTTSWDWQVSRPNFHNAIGAEGFASLKHLCLVGTKGPYTEMLSILGPLFPNLENISLPDWWPGVAGLNERCLESWPMLKTLAVGTVQPAAALLAEMRSRRVTRTLEQGMLFADRLHPIPSPSVPNVRHCLTLIQHSGVETLVLNGVIMGRDFEWVRTAMGLFPSLKMLEALVLLAGFSSGDLAPSS
jgi:hypothetical protein